MPSPANVHSVAAIESFRGALARFELRAQDAMENLTGEMRRVVDWLEHDRPRHWKVKSREAADMVHQAKIDLERCLTFRVGDERPSCREEKANLKKAQLRVEYCREKIERVEHWNRQLQQELFEYEGRIGQLRRMLEIELPAARAKLQQIVQRLDAYQVERAPLKAESIQQQIDKPQDSES
jgi:exonuclease VII large subunit